MSQVSSLFIFQRPVLNVIVHFPQLTFSESDLTVLIRFAFSKSSLLAYPRDPTSIKFSRIQQIDRFENTCRHVVSVSQIVRFVMHIFVPFLNILTAIPSDQLEVRTIVASHFENLFIFFAYSPLIPADV